MLTKLKKVVLHSLRIKNLMRAGVTLRKGLSSKQIICRNVVGNRMAVKAQYLNILRNYNIKLHQINFEDNVLVF